MVFRCGIGAGGPEQVGEAYCGRGGVEIGVVEPIALHGEDGDDVSPLTIRGLAPLAVPLELAEDLVLGRGDPQIAGRVLADVFSCWNDYPGTERLYHPDRNTVKCRPPTVGVARLCVTCTQPQMRGLDAITGPSHVEKRD